MRTPGTLEVKLGPLPKDDEAVDSSLGRFSIDKVFHGGLVGESRGEMLTARTSQADSAGSVALDRVQGTLLGRAGAFLLQHSATMTRGTPRLSTEVVPGSGTGELTGLVGTMANRIDKGRHDHDLDFTLPCGEPAADAH